eukprot:TRINITY_DN11023_c0_g1_i2.p1 TRINITY_DN11023_c0_g1~~TRINITY_DN11023_c0_g1_i2.p1  ORF type:complete len:297 (-),score=49.23 TRINITY_DN11023_c0_g1_i2:363-1253(-)
MVFDIGIRLILGVELSEEEIKEFSKLYTTMTNGMFGLSPNLPFTKLGKAFKARDALRQKLKGYIQKAIEDFKSGDNKKLWINIHMKSMVEAGFELDPDRLAEESTAMLFAAHLTTSSSLSFLNYHILMHPEVFEQIKLEQEQLIEQFGPELNYEVIQNMAYGDKVIREVLRVSPIAPVVPREATQDFELKGYKIPKGWRIQLCIGRTIVENWKDSWDKFDPQRWEGVSGNPKGYAPFGGGVRSCIGMQMALTELKTYLAVVGRKYNLEQQFQNFEKPTGSFEVFQDGLPIVFTERT